MSIDKNKSNEKIFRQQPIYEKIKHFFNNRIIFWIRDNSGYFANNPSYNMSLGTHQ